MFITLAFTAALGLAQDRPYQQSAQCLVEIARLSGERLDITNLRMVEAAQRKADALWDHSVLELKATADVEAASAEVLKEVIAAEAAGVIPPGSTEVLRREQSEERAQEVRRYRYELSLTPSCVMPSPDAEPTDAVD